MVNKNTNRKSNVNKQLIAVLNSLLEKSVKNQDYSEAFEVGIYLLQQKALVENNLKWLMVATMRTGNRKLLLNLLLDKEKEGKLLTLEKGIVSSLYYQLKNEEKCAEYALQYSRENVVSIGRAGKVRVLILQTFASGAFNFNSKTRGFHMPEGHNNFMSLLDKDIQKVILRVDDLDVALKEIKRQKITVDVIYNSITDPERCELALYKAAAICEAFPTVPVINHPRNILFLTRDNNYQRFHNVENIVYPKNLKLANVEGECHKKIMQAIEGNGLEFPIIARLSGYQGGKNMHLIYSGDSHNFEDFDKLVAQSSKDIYLIEFIDVSFKDDRIPNAQLYPKYRAFYAGGKLFPIHLFIADNDFNVHLANSESLMEENPWLINLEKEFCNSPEVAVGKNNWKALEKIMRMSGLDYVGVDFSLSQEEGRQGIVIFEINAAMRNWMRSTRAPIHVREAWEKVTRNMHHMLCDKTDTSPWDFN